MKRARTSNVSQERPWKAPRVAVTYPSGRPLSAQQKKQVRKMVYAPMEKKRWPVYKQGLLISSTHVIDPLTEIAQGDGEQDRDGDAIKIVSGFIRMAFSAVDSTNILRCTLIRWRSATTPTAAEIYDDTTIGANGAIFSPFNHNRRSLFTVLMDKFIDIENHTSGDIQKMINVSIPPQPKTVFDASALTGINKLYFIFSSDSTAASHPSVVYRGDINYVDC